LFDLDFSQESFFLFDLEFILLILETLAHIFDLSLFGFVLEALELNFVHLFLVEVVEILLLLGLLFLDVLEIIFVLAKLGFKLHQGLLAALTHSVELFVLRLLLSQGIFFHSLKLALLFFELLFLDCDIDVQLLLDLAFSTDKLLLTLLELVVSLFEVRLHDLRDVNCSLLQLV